MTAGLPLARDDGQVCPQAPVTVASLYVAHRLRLVRLAVLLVDDTETAEDVVQDVFARLHRSWRLDDPGQALPYLQRAVVNGCRSVLRRRRTVRSTFLPGERPGGGPEASAILAEEQREVLAALHRLPTRQREVLVLRYWSGLSEAQIADTLGISRGAVKSTASRALHKLEQTLEGQR